MLVKPFLLEYLHSIKHISYRFLRDMSLRDLGDAAGIHYSYVGKLEKGTVANPSREVVRGLAVVSDSVV